MSNGVELEPQDIYPDSDTDLSIYRGVTFLKVVRAVIHWYSNVGYFVRLKNGHMIAVERSEEGEFQIHIPQGE